MIPPILRESGRAPLPMKALHGVLAGALAILGGVPEAQAQLPTDLAQERRDYANWLATAPSSPFAIVVQQPVGNGLTLGGPGSDFPLQIGVPGVAREERGVVVVTQGDKRTLLPRGRPARFGDYQLLASGVPGRMTLAAYGVIQHFHAPAYYSYRPDLALTVPLEPPERTGQFRTLGLDGTESLAREAGFVAVPPGATRLRVYQIGAPDDIESSLAVFFHDATDGHGSYPAGRFVELIPAGRGLYRLDLNRARNPFCAYSSVYPCPAPWPGNTIPGPIPAGERYSPPSGTTAP
ncbi:MAG TPA: DUF1684 domain-containing protein [Gemmatimonadales bacterium]|nr:DUF1684 domain-containing protein [Gemmatimonadales bacterium]